MTVTAEVLICNASQAWQLEAPGLTLQPGDFYGLKGTQNLTVDIAAGSLTAPSGTVPGLVKTSDFEPATGADLVLAAPDGSLLFRARALDGAMPFMLVDHYDVYIGSCSQ